MCVCVCVCVCVHSVHATCTCRNTVLCIVTCSLPPPSLPPSVEGQSLGMHIAEGFAVNNKGNEVRGVFIKEIIPGSPAALSNR